MLLFAAQGWKSEDIVALIISLIGSAILIVLVLIPYRAVLFARKHDLKITVKNFMGMQLRRLNPMKIARMMLFAKEAGIDDADVLSLEAHILCGATAKGFLEALAYGRKARVSIPFDKASRMYIRNEGLMDEIQRRFKEKGYVQREEV